MSDNPTSDVTAALCGFREGDRVKAVILGIDNRRISLSLKPSHFTKEELEEDQNEDADDQNSQSEGEDSHAFAGSHIESDGGNDSDNIEKGGESEDEDLPLQDEESDDEMEVDVDQSQIEYHANNNTSASQPKASSTSSIPSLALSGGFQWSGETYEPDNGTESSDDDDEVDQPSKKKRKKKQIEHDLTADMHNKTPESNADFERLLLGSPNSSYLWIQYMSFQLPLSEVDKAREIARRAIKTINFREEKEKLNVWIAFLNLENVYGTDETLNAIFKEAAQANDSKTVHLTLAAIFDQSDKPEVCLISTRHGLLYTNPEFIIESRRAIQTNDQKVRSKFQGLDSLW